MNWIDIKERKPNAYIEGCFDGKKSDLLLFRSEEEGVSAGYMYEGFLDGKYFCEFYIKGVYFKEWFANQNITHWAEITPPQTK